MELVPIVITVLEIVTALAVATLSISYILFKVKKKTKPESTVSSINSHDMKPHFVDRGLKRLTQITREILPPIKREEVKRPAVPQKKVEEKRSVERRPEERKSQAKEKRPDQKQQPVERKTERREEINSRRIEVINNSPLQKISGQKKEDSEYIKNRSDLNSLGNEILDKYDDDDDSKLFTLKTSKKEDNTK